MLLNQKYRVSNIAKDFNLKNKEVIELLNMNTSSTDTEVVLECFIKYGYT